MNVWFLPSQTIQARPACASRSWSCSTRRGGRTGGASSGPCVPQGAVVRAEGVGRGWVVILGAWVVSVTHQGVGWPFDPFANGGSCPPFPPCVSSPSAPKVALRFCTDIVSTFPRHAVTTQAP